MKKPRFISPLSFLAGLIFLLPPGRLASQSPKIFFEEYGVAEGLPEEYVINLLQDKQGFIWFTTQNGLVKYDGYAFQVFRDEIRKDYNNLRRGLMQGRDDKIWIGGEGLVCYDPKLERFQNYPYQPDSTTFFPFEAVEPILEDVAGNIWFLNFPPGIDTAVVGRLNIKNRQISFYPHRTLYYPRRNDFVLNGGFAASESDSSVWLLDRQANLWSWRPGTDTFEIVLSPDKQISNYDFRDSLSRIMPTRGQGILMVGKQGLYLWDPVERKVINRYQHDPANSNGLLPEKISYAFEDIHGDYWAMHDGGNMTQIDPRRNRFTRHVLGKGALNLVHAPDSILFVDLYDMNAKGIWFEPQPPGEYLHYRFDTRTFEYYDRHFNETSNQFPKQSNWRRFLLDHSGLIWMGFRPNLYKEAPKRQIRELYTHDPANEKGLPSSFICYLYEDHTGTLWVGTDNGLASFDPVSDQFEVFQPNPGQPPPLRDHKITKILEDREENLWIGTDKGLFRWTRRAQHLDHFTFSANGNDFITALIEDQSQRLWVAIFGKGIYQLDKKEGRTIRKFVHDPLDSTSLADKVRIYRIFEDSRGRLWFGGYGGSGAGLYGLSKDEHSLIPYANQANDSTSISNNDILFIREDSKGRLWIGTDGGGLNLYVYPTDRFTHFHRPTDFNSIPTFAEDQAGQLWAGTYAGGGLALIDPETKTLQLFGEKDGMLHNDVDNGEFYNGAMIYSYNRMWIPTPRGLSVFDTRTKTFTNHFEGSGFIPRVFPFRTPTYQTRDQSIWVGCEAGLYRIYPDRLLQKDSIPPKVVITGMAIAGTQYTAPDEKILQNAVAYTHEIHLSHDQKDLAFGFVGLHYLQPAENQYSWKLEPYEDDWSTPTKDRRAVYTNLSPGAYTFRVRAANADGIWNEEGASIRIIIAPPWWQTWWAYGLYILILIAAVWAFIRWRLSYLRLQFERETAFAKASAAEEANEAKSAFLSTVSHELRTPLTSIIGFTKLNKKSLEEKVIPKVDPADDKARKAARRIAQNLDIVESEGQRLTTLINDLLDLAKIEAGKVEWKMTEVHPREIIEQATAATSALFEQKPAVKFLKEIPNDLPKITADRDRIIQVLINLISNAVKFTDAGTVKLGVQISPSNRDRLAEPHRRFGGGTFSRELIFFVSDTGTGIPPEHLGLIFEKFRQVDDQQNGRPKGTGLGLPICKEIVEHHDGRIWVESTQNEGSTFSFALPVLTEQ